MQNGIEISRTDAFEAELIRRFFNPKSYFFLSLNVRLISEIKTLSNATREDPFQLINRLVSKLLVSPDPFALWQNLIELRGMKKVGEFFLVQINWLRDEKLLGDNLKNAIEKMAQEFVDVLHKTLLDEPVRKEIENFLGPVIVKSGKKSNKRSADAIPEMEPEVDVLAASMESTSPNYLDEDFATPLFAHFRQEVNEIIRRINEYTAAFRENRANTRIFKGIQKQFTDLKDLAMIQGLELVEELSFKILNIIRLVADLHLQGDKHFYELVREATTILDLYLSSSLNEADVRKIMNKIHGLKDTLNKSQPRIKAAPVSIKAKGTVTPEDLEPEAPETGETTTAKSSEMRSREKSESGIKEIFEDQYEPAVQDGDEILFVDKEEANAAVVERNIPGQDSVEDEEDVELFEYELEDLEDEAEIPVNVSDADQENQDIWDSLSADKSEESEEDDENISLSHLIESEDEEFKAIDYSEVNTPETDEDDSDSLDLFRVASDDDEHFDEGTPDSILALEERGDSDEFIPPAEFTEDDEALDEMPFIEESDDVTSLIDQIRNNKHNGDEAEPTEEIDLGQITENGFDESETIAFDIPQTESEMLPADEDDSTETSAYDAKTENLENENAGLKEFSLDEIENDSVFSPKEPGEEFEKSISEFDIKEFDITDDSDEFEENAIRARLSAENKPIDEPEPGLEKAEIKKTEKDIDKAGIKVEKKSEPDSRTEMSIEELMFDSFVDDAGELDELEPVTVVDEPTMDSVFTADEKPVSIKEVQLSEESKKTVEPEILEIYSQKGEDVVAPEAAKDTITLPGEDDIELKELINEILTSRSDSFYAESSDETYIPEKNKTDGAKVHAIEESNSADNSKTSVVRQKVTEITGEDMFAKESSLYLKIIDDALTKLYDDPKDDANIEDIELSAYSLKQLALKMGFESLSHVPEKVEKIMTRLAEQQNQISAHEIEKIRKAVEFLRSFHKDESQNAVKLKEILHALN